MRPRRCHRIFSQGRVHGALPSHDSQMKVARPLTWPMGTKPQTRESLEFWPYLDTELEKAIAELAKAA